MARWLWAAAVVCAAGCGDGPEGGGGGGGAAGAGTLVFARGADASSLDPAVVTDGESVKVLTNVFDTLVRFQPGTLDLAPGLAERWEASEDGRVWTFHLREARFHDGTPVDAEAVVFSFLRQKDKDHPAHTEECPYWEDTFSLVTDVRARDPRTVEVRLSEPFAPFEASMTLFSMSIVSPAAWASEGRGDDGKFRYRFAERPVGSGPFRFVRWNRDDTIVLEANPDHWAGPPGVGTLVFKVIGENAQRLLAAESGQAHIVDGLNLQDAPRVARSDRLELVERPGINFGYLAMNTMKEPFGDARVRLAVALAVSKEKIRASAYDGQGRVAVTALPQGMPGHLELEDRAQDVARARSLLAEAGFPDGFETTLWCGDNPRTYMPRPKDVAIQIAQDLGAIGIAARIEQVQWSRYLEDVQNGRHDMCLLGWMADYGDPDNFLYVLLDKTNARVGSSNNVSFWRDEPYHELVSRARTLVGDRAARMELYAQAQRRAFEEVPILPLLQVPELRAVARNVKGYVIYPAGGEYLASVRLE